MIAETNAQLRASRGHEPTVSLSKRPNVKPSSGHLGTRSHAEDYTTRGGSCSAALLSATTVPSALPWPTSTVSPTCGGCENFLYCYQDRREMTDLLLMNAFTDPSAVIGVCITKVNHQPAQVR